MKEASHNAGFFDRARNSYMAFLGAFLGSLRPISNIDSSSAFWVAVVALAGVWLYKAALRLKTIGMSWVWSIPVVAVSLSFLRWPEMRFLWLGILLVNLPLALLPSHQRAGTIE